VYHGKSSRRLQTAALPALTPSSPHAATITASSGAAHRILLFLRAEPRVRGGRTSCLDTLHHSLYGEPQMHTKHLIAIVTALLMLAPPSR